MCIVLLFERREWQTEEIVTSNSEADSSLLKTDATVEPTTKKNAYMIRPALVLEKLQTKCAGSLCIMPLKCSEVNTNTFSKASLLKNYQTPFPTIYNIKSYKGSEKSSTVHDFARHGTSLTN